MLPIPTEKPSVTKSGWSHPDAAHVVAPKWIFFLLHPFITRCETRLKSLNPFIVSTSHAPNPGIKNSFTVHRVPSSLCLEFLVKIAALSRRSGQRKPIMRIGPYKLKNNLFLAPMAGVTDRPFRRLCRRLGAGMAASEMVSSNSLLWGTQKTLRRADHAGEEDPRAVQIVGSTPAMMAQAARYNVDNGAQIIDISMGCPAKKICNVFAGSALMQNEKLVAEILEAI